MAVLLEEPFDGDDVRYNTVILSEANNLTKSVYARSLAALGMTIKKRALVAE